MRRHSMDSGTRRTSLHMQKNDHAKSILPEDTSIQYYSSDACDKSKNYEDGDQKEDVVKVFVRIKPSKGKKYRAVDESCVKIVNDNGLMLLQPNKEQYKNFAFEKVFDGEASQEEVFHRSTAPLLKHALMGYNGTVFVYGQTGTGKTHTMGILSKLSYNSKGIIPLTMKYLFNYFNEVDTHYKDQYKWEVSVSLVQVYLDEVFDLLNPGKVGLPIREDPESREVFLEDLVTVPVRTFDQALELVNAGILSRSSASQSLNESSSRSHFILNFGLTQEFLDMNGTKKNITSKLTLIDLAGSERVRKTTSSGLRLEEAKSINSSLSALGNVITALGCPNKNGFVPYRASKLTRVLQNSLSSQSKISLIATISNDPNNFHETLSTLAFAQRCKEMLLKPRINPAIEESENLDQFMQKMQQEMEKLTQSFFRKEQEYKDKIKQCESEIELLRKSTLHLNPISQSPSSEYTSSAEYEKSEYLYKLLRSLRDNLFTKFAFNKVEESLTLREQILNKYKDHPQADEFCLQFEELSRRYGSDSHEIDLQNFDDEERTLTNLTLESAINIIQKTGKMLVEVVKTLSNSSMNAEKIKEQLIMERLLEKKVSHKIVIDEKDEKLECALAYMVKYTLDLTRENINLRYIDEDEEVRKNLLRLKNKGIEDLLAQLLTNKNYSQLESTASKSRPNQTQPVSSRVELIIPQVTERFVQDKKSLSPVSNRNMETTSVLNEYVDNLSGSIDKQLIKLASKDVENHFISNETISTGLEESSSYRKASNSELHKLKDIDEQCNDSSINKEVVTNSEEDITEPIGEYSIISPRYSTTRAHELNSRRASIKTHEDQIRDSQLEFDDLKENLLNNSNIQQQQQVRAQSRSSLKLLLKPPRKQSISKEVSKLTQSHLDQDKQCGKPPRRESLHQKVVESHNHISTDEDERARNCSSHQSHSKLSSLSKLQNLSNLDVTRREDYSKASEDDHSEDKKAHEYESQDSKVFESVEEDDEIKILKSQVNVQGWSNYSPFSISKDHKLQKIREEVPNMVIQSQIASQYNTQSIKAKTSATKMDTTINVDSPVLVNSHSNTTMNNQKNLTNLRSRYHSVDGKIDTEKGEVTNQSDRARNEKVKIFETDYSRFSQEKIEIIKAFESFDVERYENEEGSNTRKSRSTSITKPSSSNSEDVFDSTDSTRSKVADQDSLSAEFCNYIYSNFKKRAKSPVEVKTVNERTVPIKDRPFAPKIKNVQEAEEHSQEVIGEDDSDSTTGVKKFKVRRGAINELLRRDNIIDPQFRFLARR